MKKIFLVLFVLCCTLVVIGQDKEVAVLNPKTLSGTVSNNDKLIIVSSMKKAFTQIDGYKAFTRSSQALIDAEQEFQRSGKVSEASIKKMGGQNGAAFICTFTLSLEKNELVVNSDIIDVESGEIMNSDFIALLDRTDRNDVMEQCQTLAYALLGASYEGGNAKQAATNRNSANNQSSRIDGNVKQPIAQRHPAEPEMVSVAGGTFWMGCSGEQGSDCFSDESPLHSVTVSGFAIGKYEVTQAQWKLIMGSNPSHFKGDNLPVETVSWDDAQEFISRLNAATGKHYRLPTEAEWEYAARGGNKSQNYKYSGSHNLNNVGWFDDNSSSQTHPVGTKLANELGIHDMSGNVWEWCSDWKGTYSSSQQQDPMGASSGSYRVIRGGSWAFSAANCRVSLRDRGTPSSRRSDMGFRLVLPL
ncbi:hypothetical protein FACS1894199_15850 [Bacteroidia bacterium]|nr:hypothetical protein FACS1894199_15850 [Bacteroidia bacterium]